VDYDEFCAVLIEVSNTIQDYENFKTLQGRRMSLQLEILPLPVVERFHECGLGTHSIVKILSKLGLPMNEPIFSRWIKESYDSNALVNLNSNMIWPLGTACTDGYAKTDL